MRTVSRILLPVDFSPRGAGAVRYAAALADHFHADVTVLHVIEKFPWVPLSAWEYSPDFEMEAERGYQEGKRRELESYCPETLGQLKVKRVLAVGNPADMIVRQSREDQSDLIVMPTRGCGRFRRLLLGSVTSKVLHDASCPVWTGVHMDETAERDWKAIRSVLCAVDCSVESPAVVKWAADFSAEFGADLTIMRAIPSLDPSAGEYFDPNWWKVVASQARESVISVKAAAGTERGEVRIEEGRPAEAVARVAGQTHADLVVIGRNTVDTVVGRLLEDAYAIIRESPCPVVSV